ncbi:N5-carboxyaminoimidazole ribonucleotide synthase [Balamuthia mandrillaris]
MPRGIPVGTLAIGESGAVNAAILAASCLASCADYPHIEEALRAFRQAQTDAVAEFPVDETSPSSSSSHTAKTTESERVFDVSKEQVNKACKQTLGRALPTGSVVGIMGGGQLAKMIITAATQLGYRTHVYCPDPHSPAFQVTDRKTVAPYLDKAALQMFAAEVDVITYEFENIPLETVQFLATMRPVRPDPSVLAVCQNRVKEKSFVNETLVGCSCPETMEATTIFAEVSNVEQLKAQTVRLGLPVVLKTNEGGYDGKGQVIIRHEDEVEAAWGKLARGGSSSPLILEKFVEFQTEVSMIVARSEDGTVSTFPLVENFHQNHILKRSVIPPFSSSASSTNSINKAQLEKTSEAASSIVRRLAEGFQLVGVVCVEMFLMADGKLLVNEMAPRPHNSGHWTIEACETSQFAQLVRAICGLPLGGTRLLLPASSSAEGRVEMINLLGKEVEEAMDLLRDNVNAHVHIYGKNEAKEGRKMGHVTFLY